MHFLRRFLGRDLQAEREAGKQFRLNPAERTEPAESALAITAIVKDEADYLDEWLSFHRRVGAEHFYIYDNESTDGTAELLARYNFVTVLPWPSLIGWDGQCAAYAHAVSCYRKKCRWMMFIDVDEFVFPSSGNTLTESLKSYEHLPGIRLPWRCFGPNGHTTKPDAPVIESYTKRAVIPCSSAAMTKRLTKTKCIVDPCRVTKIHVHRCEFVEGSDEIVTDSILLNHYFTKSEAEFAAKLERGFSYASISNDPQRDRRSRNIRTAIESHSVEDLAILRLIG